MPNEEWFGGRGDGEEVINVGNCPSACVRNWEFAWNNHNIQCVGAKIKIIL